MTKLLCVLAATLVLVAAAGCSGDDDAAETGAQPTTPSASETTAPSTTAPSTTAPAGTGKTRPEPPEDQSRWAREVDVACKRWQEQIDAVAPPASPGDLEPWLAETLPLIRKQVAAVEAVKPPTAADNAERAALFIGNLRIVEQALTKYRAALRANNAQAAREALAQAGSAGAEARTAALAAGVTECGGYSGG